jgi:hypothetical protein
LIVVSAVYIYGVRNPTREKPYCIFRIGYFREIDPALAFVITTLKMLPNV